MLRAQSFGSIVLDLRSDLMLRKSKWLLYTRKTSILLQEDI